MNNRTRAESPRRAWSVVRRAALALLVAGAGTTVAATDGAANDTQRDVAPVSSYAYAPPADAPPSPVRLTAAEVEASNAKALVAYHALVELWTQEFDNAGAQFVAPRLVRYRAPVRSACGVIAPSNAAYCFNGNTIYFDDVFVAAQAKIAGQALGTDGDMAGLGIIAHEMGHAVAMQLGIRSRRTYDNEAIADCLSGAFAKHAEATGSLEHGDLEEAFFGMAAAADPVFQPTGNERMDRVMAARLERGAHGTREQRTQNFERGYQGGGAACVPHLQAA